MADDVERSASNVENRAIGLRELGRSSLAAGDLELAASRFLDGANQIQNFLRRGTTSASSELDELKDELLLEYVETIDAQCADSMEHLDVWKAVAETRKMGLRRIEILRKGVSRLETWWDLKVQRDRPTVGAGDTMKTNLDLLSRILQEFAGSAPAEAAAKSLTAKRDALRASLDTYFDAL